MNERIEQLEQALRRWKRVCLGLVLFILCLFAGSGTMIGLLMRQLPGQFDFMFPWTRMRADKEAAELLMLDELRAIQAQQDEADRRVAEFVKHQEKRVPDGDQP